MGGTVEDVGQPTPSFGAALPRLWTAELVLRPLGTNRLEVALGAAHADGDAWDRIVPRARLSATRRRTACASTPRGRACRTGRRWRSRAAATPASAFGLAIDFDHTGAVVGVPVLVPGSGGSTGAGFAARLHLEGERRPAAGGRGYVARVHIEKDRRAIAPSSSWCAGCARWRSIRPPSACSSRSKTSTSATARIEELRDLVALLRASGKRTFAYLTFPSTREYYLAAACDTIVMHPAGEASVTGVAQNVTFYKGTMDRLGVHLELVRVGKYKGAMEPFIMTEQSPDVRDNKNQLLDDVFGRVVAAHRRRIARAPATRSTSRSCGR